MAGALRFRITFLAFFAFLAFLAFLVTFFTDFLPGLFDFDRERDRDLVFEVDLERERDLERDFERDLERDRDLLEVRTTLNKAPFFTSDFSLTARANAIRT